MDYREIGKQCLALAREKFEEAEVYIGSSQAIAIKYFNTDLESYEIAEEGGMSLQVRRGNLWARAYSEKVSLDSVETLLETVEQILEVQSENPDISIYAPETGDGGASEGEAMGEIADVEGAGVEAPGEGGDAVAVAGMESAPVVVAPVDVPQTDTDFDTETMLNHCRALAEKGVTYREDVKLMQVSCSAHKEQVLIMNTKGLDKQQSSSYSYIHTTIILDRDGVMKNGSAFRYVSDFNDLSVDEIVAEAYAKADATYEAKSFAPGKYNMVLENEVFASLLHHLVSSMSADNVQLGRSLLADKLGQPIAASSITLSDEPASPLGVTKRIFDDEGVTCRPLPLIKDGVLCNFLHNLETAAKAGVPSTGNAQRSYKGKSVPGASTLIMAPGTQSLDELFSGMGRGLYITDLQGLHAGLNPISGDFSLPAEGFVIEDGKKARAVDQITVAGNLFQMMQQVEAVGKDRKLTMYGSYVPSVLVSGMSVSGSE